MTTYTREHLLGVLRAGGTVLHDGRLIENEAQLPAEAELARGDPAREGAARAALEAQIATLQRQLGLLPAGPPPAGPPAVPAAGPQEVIVPPPDRGQPQAPPPPADEPPPQEEDRPGLFVRKKK